MKTRRDLDFNYKSFAEEIKKDTSLSEREAELYILKTKGDCSTSEASNIMGISSNNARGKLGIIRNKIAEAHRTVKLDDI